MTTTHDRMLNNFALLKPLGDGTFGVGWAAVNTDTNEKVCVKIFKNLDEATVKTFETEIGFAQQVNHPNVLKTLGAGRDQVVKRGTPAEEDSYYIVSELAANGEAFDYVSECGGLKPEFARRLFYQLLQGVHHLHENNIAHRDLKLENCFLDANVILKVADFGLSKAFAGENGQELRTRLGTESYMAPELYNENEAYDGPAVDIFAMGVMLFMLIEASFPFSEQGDIWYRRLQKDPRLYMKARKRDMDISFLELVAGMLRADPKERFSVEQIMQADWMQGPMVEEQDIYNHFYELKAQANAECQENYDKNCAMKNKFSGSDAAMRGPNSLSIEAFDEMMDVWKELKYFEHDNSGAKTKGFKTQSVGTKVFARLWRYLETLEDEDKPSFMLKSDPCVSETNWKMAFELQAVPVEEEEVKLEDDVSEGEEKEANPFKIEVRINAIGEEAEGDRPLQVQVVRKEGSIVDFNNFYKKMMGDAMHMFVEPETQQ